MEKLKELSWESLLYMILVCFVGFFGGVAIAICVTQCFGCKKKTKIIPEKNKNNYIIVINPSENPQIGVINANI